MVITLAAQLLGALLASLAGRKIESGGTSARVLATLGVITWGGGFVADHLQEPSRGFVALVGVAAVVLALWPAVDLLPAVAPRHRGNDDVVAACIVAAVAALGAWFSPHPSAISMVALSLSVVASGALFGTRSLLERLYRWQRLAVVGLVALSAVAPIAIAVAALLHFFLGNAVDDRALVGLVPLSVLGPLAMLGVTLRHRRRGERVAGSDPSLVDVVLLHPPRILVASFSLLCLVGTFLLALPMASADGQGIALIDAAFTAVSATCVTGLAVKDTAVDFSLWGQFVLFAFIQVGGLGIMVFSAAAVVVLGRRLSVHHEAAAVDLVGATGRAGLSQAVRGILLVSIATEVVSALLLWPAFIVAGDDVGTALWRAVFTAVSAFCNAGFALQSSSLISYAHSPFILLVVGLTFVLGGIGPAVVASVVQRRRLSVQARLVLVTSAVLLVVPGLLILILEWGASLEGLSVVDKVTNALFQSATLRTAGFNSVDFASITPATWTLMLVVMFVGGSPGSTAGGVKTTTVAVIALAVLAIVRGQDRVDVAGRTIPATTILRAAAAMTIGVLSCLGAIMALQLTQEIPLDVLVFEVVSALGTVGISMGGTALLDEVGKVVIILCMFAGRIGPLTFFVFLASRTPHRPSVRWPEEQVAVG